MRDLVIGIDASTSAVKGIAFNRTGHPEAEAREDYSTSNPLPGHFEQDAVDWWRALTAVTRRLTAEVDAGRIAAIAIGHQRETFTLLDPDGRPVRPAILWLDERARDQVARLSDELGRERIRDISGKPPDPTPALYALAWLREHEPDIIDRASVVVDVHAFLIHRLTGRLATAIAAADPLGLIDIAAGTWDPILVAAAGLDPRHLLELVSSGERIGALSAEAAVATGLLKGTPVIAGAGDGQMAGLGVGAVDERTGYLSLGTGIVAGLYCRKCRTSDAHRTLTSPTGQGYMVEAVLRSGMSLVDWAARMMSGGEKAEAKTLERFSNEAERVGPGAGGVMVLPYWAGVMNPYWSPQARGVVIGLSLDHGPGHVFRAVLEGLAFEQAVAVSAMEASIGRRAERFVVSGGGARSRLLMTILAAVLGRPLAKSSVADAVALGAAILAAVGSGWYPSVAEAVAGMVSAPSEEVQPDPILAATYAPMLDVYGRLFSETSRIVSDAQIAYGRVPRPQ